MDLRTTVNPDPRSHLPSIERLRREVEEAEPALPPWAVLEACRAEVESARAEISRFNSGNPAEKGEQFQEAPSIANRFANYDWVARVAARAAQLAASHPRPVLNATGVVLHTNLGRAPLAAGAAQAAAEAAQGYSDLELDLTTGARGNRLANLGELLRLLSGAEAGYACNNCAAALMLALDTLGRGREVIVSRGELVEIGGSFRVPAVMEKAGVRLVEVGTTNRTHPHDYEQAIGPNTALLLKVHRSNFEQRGFVAEVGLGELVEIGRRHSLPVVEDLGSGTLLDLPGLGLPADSHVPSRVGTGADLVCFSGDKLLGGPQAGLVVGRAEVVAAMRSNPLARALRLDKMTLAALEWTLRSMLDGDAPESLPVLRFLLAQPEHLEARARSLAARLRAGLPDAIRIEVEPDRAVVGGGSLPGFELDTWVVALRGGGVHDMASALRSGAVPAVARVRDHALLLDLRTVDEADQLALEKAVIDALG